MKNTLFLLLAVTVLLSACKKQPAAAFSVDEQNPYPADEINFTNLSVNGVSYSWDFGDGTSSIEENPSHVYSAPGEYNVVLTAYSKKEKKMAVSSMHINVETTFDRITGVWDYDTQLNNTYKNNVLETSSITNILDTYGPFTVGFYADNVALYSVLGLTTTSTWSVLVEGKTILIDADTLEFTTLNSNELELVLVDTYSVGTDAFIDSNFYAYSR